MRTLLLLAATGSAMLAAAQVHVDRPLVLTAADSSARSVSGLAPAVTGNGLITLGDARSGRYRWAQVGGTGMALTLSLDPPCEAYVSGLGVRFLPNAPGSGPVTFNVNGLGAKRVYRGDGTLVTAGELEPGVITQAIYADTAFFLTARAAEGCPTGFLSARPSLCFMQHDTLNLSVYNATKWCMDRGARLCTWDEYIQACTALQAQLSGLFDDWEWIDDTSDHTHTGNQAGRYGCRSQRSWGAVEDPNNYARVRCCLTVR